MQIGKSRSLFPKIHILVSHAFLRDNQLMTDIMLAIAPYANIMIDSGAFTNFTAIRDKRKNYNPITIAEYIDRCKTVYHPHMWQYVMLDVIMQPDETNKNLKQMVDNGLRPMPVLTPNAPVSEALELLKINRRLAISGGATAKNEKLIVQRFQQVYRYSNGQSLIHALGYMRHPEIFQLPLATVDASSMNVGARYGTMSVYDKIRGLENISWQDVSKPKSAAAKRILGKLLAYEIPLSTLTNKENYRTSTSIPALVTLYSYALYSAHCSEQHVGLFFSLSSPIWLFMTLAVYAASDMRGFNYNDAKAITLELREKAKSDPARVAYMCEEIVRTRTAYVDNILTEDQTLKSGKNLLNGNQIPG